MTTSDAPPRPPGRPRKGRYTGSYQVLGDVELSPEEHAEAKRQIDQADSERADVSVTFRWGKKQLQIVRRAAQIAGIPYQTYLKGAVMRGAIEDLRKAREAGVLDTQVDILAVDARDRGVNVVEAKAVETHEALMARSGLPTLPPALQQKMAALQAELRAETTKPATAERERRITELLEAMTLLRGDFDEPSATPPPTTS